jgi:hypothetical protein
MMEIESNELEDTDFDVVGAGIFRIGNSAKCRCGGKTGFSIGVEWGQHGFAGGVMDKKDAIRLAQHILRISNLEELGV